MTLLKFKPGRELLRDSMVPSQMLNLFDNFFNEAAGKFERNVFFTPRVDVVESDKQFEVRVSLPGLKKDEVNVDLDGEVLTISGERKMKRASDSDKYHMVENFYGNFSRSFTLPENIDKSGLVAELNDGILEIRIPKAEVKESKTAIKIN